MWAARAWGGGSDHPSRARVAAVGAAAGSQQLARGCAGLRRGIPVPSDNWAFGTTQIRPGAASLRVDRYVVP